LEVELLMRVLLRR